MSVLILEAPDMVQEFLGRSEARAIQEILKLLKVQTSEVVILKDGSDLFQILFQLNNYEAIYLSTHSCSKGFGVSSGFFTSWESCGKILDECPNVKFLFLSGCEAAHLDAALAITNNCKNIKYIIGPIDKPSFEQATLAAHLIFYYLLVKKMKPGLAAVLAGAMVDLRYTYWDCDSLRQNANIYSLLQMIQSKQQS